MILTVIGVTKTSIEKNNIATNAPRWIACGTDASAPQQQKIGSSQQVGFHVLSDQKDHKGWVVNQPNKSSEDFLNIIKKSCEKMISWQFCDCDLLGMVSSRDPNSKLIMWSGIGRGHGGIVDVSRGHHVPSSHKHIVQWKTGCISFFAITCLSNTTPFSTAPMDYGKLPVHIWVWFHQVLNKTFSCSRPLHGWKCTLSRIPSLHPCMDALKKNWKFNPQTRS